MFSKSLVKISDFGLSRALGVGKDYYQEKIMKSLNLFVSKIHDRFDCDTLKTRFEQYASCNNKYDFQNFHGAITVGK